MRFVMTLVYLVAALPLAATDFDWRFSQRDVYIDGSLDRSAIVYLLEEKALVVSPKMKRAVVLDAESREVREVALRDVETSDDLTRAALTSWPSKPRATLTQTADGVLTAHIRRTDLVVAPHESVPGVIDAATLGSDYPVWARLHDIYTPDDESVRRLTTITEPTDVTIVFATWCGDSRREVPRLLRAVRAAGNSNIRLHLMGLGPDFDPFEFIQERHVINVPTVIVERGGVELGRIVETPASGLVERDLADIMSGTLGTHDGRWERGQQVASGRYALTWDDGREGSETWRLFSSEDGGQLAHSVIDDGMFVREVWHRVDANGQTTFVEVTDRAGDLLRRTRYRLRDGELRAHSRGNHSGIIDQTLAIPKDCSIATGAIATAGWACGVPDNTKVSAVSYNLPLDSRSALGSTSIVTLDHAGSTSLDRLGIPVRARHVQSTHESVTSDLWIDADLGVPLRLDGDGVHAELVRLEM